MIVINGTINTINTINTIGTAVYTNLKVVSIKQAIAQKNVYCEKKNNLAHYYFLCNNRAQYVGDGVTLLAAAAVRSKCLV